MLRLIGHSAPTLTCFSMASHPRKFISQPTDDDLKRFPEQVKHLVKKGREQRYVTHQEIIAAVPNAEEDVDLLDEIYTLFVDLGIQVIDVKDALIWEKKGSRKSTLELPEPTEDLTEVAAGADEGSDDEDADLDEGEKVESLKEEADGDAMRMVALAGIAVDSDKDLSEEERKKRKKEREIDLLEISNDSVRS